MSLIGGGMSSNGTGAGDTVPIKMQMESKQPKVEDNVTTSEIGSSIVSISDLKMAEMRGDYYTISDEQVVKAIEKAIKAAEGRSTSFEFSIHEKTKKISVKVLDKDTGEVIREVPPEKSLDMLAKLWEMAGIMVDERR